MCVTCKASLYRTQSGVPRGVRGLEQIQAEATTPLQSLYLASKHFRFIHTTSCVIIVLRELLETCLDSYVEMYE